MGLLAFFLLLALSVSFLCSVLEAVLLSSTTSYIEKLEMEGKDVSAMKKWKKNMEKALSAILSLNTIAHTIGSAGVGAQVTKLWGNAYFGIASIVLTILILVLSEILPKSIGTNYWKSLTVFAGKTISVLVIIMYPFVIVSKQLTRIFSKKKEEQTVSKEEIAVMADIGHKEGVFDETQNKIIQNIIKLSDITVNRIMTPRTVMVAAQEDITIQDFLENKEFLTFSRIPVYGKSLDDVDGYVLRYDLIENYSEEKAQMPIRIFKREIAVTYEYNTLIDTWEQLSKKREHLAVVVSEYGGVEGLITLEDIIETIIGLEIVDERDNTPDMQENAKERWKQRQVEENLHVSNSDE
ncbi:CNNM domain-containing protein [Bacteroidales bacterium OttesenSCG-928-C19]|nr:CNNM domain-containing protein [Bacteroidales bacterium OttesenSCG-928-C19]